MQNLNTLDSIASGVGAVGQVAQGFAGYQAGQANAAVDRANAQQSLMQGAADQASSNAKYRAAIGEQLVSQGGSGLQMGTGSMLDAINQSRINQTFAAMEISQQAASRAAAYNQQANMASSGATGKLLAGLLTGTSSFLSKRADYANAGAAYGYGGGGGDTDPSDQGGALRIVPGAGSAGNGSAAAAKGSAITDNALNTGDMLDKGASSLW